MTVATPWMLWATAVAVAGVIGAHLLSVGRPPVLALPTARFVPEGTLTAVSRARRPTDRRLLLLRVLALLAAGLAGAGVRIAPSRVPVASVVVLDPAVFADARWVATARDVFAAHAPVRALVPGTGVVRTDARALAVVVLDSVGRDTLGRAALGRDALGRDARAVHHGSLAAALLSARRVAASLARDADSLALIVVTPLREDATTAALDVVRATWPGRVQVRALESAIDATAAASPPAPRVAAAVTVRARGDDVVAAALRRWSPVAATAVRVVRDTIAVDDSTFARDGGVVVDWRERTAGDASAPRATAPRASAVAANGVALVAPIVRARDATVIDSVQQAVAWFGDGAPAVTEQPLGDGCVRRVHFDAPEGDVLLGASARGLLAALAAPCGVRGTLAAARPISRTRLDDGAGALAPRAAFGAPVDATPAWLTRALLALALLLLLVEQWFRNRARGVSGRAAASLAPGAT